MALPSLVSVDDFATWLGESIVNEDRAEAVLAAASTLVRTSAGRMWVDADGIPDDDLTATQLHAAETVVNLVAERVWFNSRGITQESAGPFSRSISAWAALGLELTDSERAMLGTGTSTSGVPGLSSVRLIAPAAASGSRRFVWWDSDDDEDASS